MTPCCGFGPFPSIVPRGPQFLALLSPSASEGKKEIAITKHAVDLAIHLLSIYVPISFCPSVYLSVIPKIEVCCMCRWSKHSSKEALDLSSLAALQTGGEPLLPTSVRDFCDTFRSHGFNAHLVPSYGLAEHVVGTSMHACMCVCSGSV